MAAPADPPVVVVHHPADCQACLITIDGVERRMLSPQEIAARWGLSVKVIYRLIREKRMRVLNLSPGTHGGKGDRYRVSCCVIRTLEASSDDPVPPHH